MRDYDDDEVLRPSSEMVIDFQRSLQRIENNIDDMRRRYMGARVVKPFYDDRLGGRHEYVGQVTGANWYVKDGCILFKVTYDSDNDEEEMEHWELQKYLS